MDSNSDSRTGDRKRTGIEPIHDEQDGIEISGYVAHDDQEGSATVDPGGPATSTVRLHVDDPDGEETLIGVGAAWDADTPPSVYLKHIHPAVTLTNELTPSRARELAAELRLAATHAEQGAGEAGWSDE